jgi:hypothetical protein
MSDPIVPTSHDAILHMGDTHLGILFKPYTFRMSYQPDFIGRLTTGDPSGVDAAPWRMFTQQSFHQGAGQYLWSSPNANAGYAESKGMVVGMPNNMAGILMREEPAWSFGQNQSPMGHIQTDIWPMTATAATSGYGTFATSLPISLFEWSNRPLIVHNRGAYAFTGADWPSTLRGVFHKVANFTFPVPAINVVQFSNILIAAAGASGLMNYPQNNSLGVYTPRYSTSAFKVGVYDQKLWRTDGHKVSYLNPAFATTDAQWSTPFDVGEAAIPITNMKEYAGRLYFGKADGLYVFDAGRIYKIQDYAQAYDDSNFKLMETLQGALYYNVSNELNRITGSGVIERLRTPWLPDDIVAGGTGDNELYLLAADYSINRSNLWIFNPETGGIRNWLAHGVGASTGLIPSFVGALRGQVFMAPYQMTGEASYLDKMPIAMADRRYLYRNQDNSLWHGINGELITSSFDFGLPNYQKQFNKLEVKLQQGSNWSTDVYYGDLYSMVSKTAATPAIPPPDWGGYLPTGVSNFGIETRSRNLAGIGWVDPYGVYPVFANYGTSSKGGVATSYPRTDLGVTYPLGIPDDSTKFNLVIKCAVHTKYEQLQLRFKNYDVALSLGTNPSCWTLNYRAPKVMVSTAISWTGDFIDQSLLSWIPKSSSNSPASLVVALNSVPNFGAFSNQYVVHVWEHSAWNSGNALARVEILDGAWVSPTIMGQAALLGRPSQGGGMAWSWNYLGNCLGEQQKFELDFPKDLRSENMILRFQPRQLAPTNLPWELASFGIQYQPVGKAYRQWDGTVVAAKNIELNNLEKESNYDNIMLTMNSLLGSRLPAVVELPFPSHETVWARVSLAEQGIVPPFPDEGGCEIPIKITEL